VLVRPCTPVRNVITRTRSGQCTDHALTGGRHQYQTDTWNDSGTAAAAAAAADTDDDSGC